MPLQTLRHRLLRVVLRTPLHQTVSRRFMLLTQVDRTPLRPAVPLRYAVHEEVLIVLARPEAAWWQPLPAMQPTTVAAKHKGRVTPMSATLADGEQLDHAILRYLQKYPGEWKELGVGAGADEQAMQQAAQGCVVVLFVTAQPA